MKEFFKDMSRDMTLLVLDAWYYGEYYGFKNWYEDIPPVKPYIIMINNKGLTDVFYDEEGINWILETTINKIKEDPDFIKVTIDKYYKLIEEIKTFWNKTQPLTKEELITFFYLLREATTGLEIAYRFPYAKDKPGIKKEDIDYALKARFATEKFYDNCDTTVRKALETMYPELNALSHFLTIQEIEANALPNLEELKKRKQHYIFTEGKLSTKTVEEIEQLYQIKIPKENIPKNTDSIKGTTGCKGIATGKVRVVITKDKIDKVLPGEILVAPMTTPAYLPAMHKAKAFITDEGGITCHAAIVARELNKPCIIGTKFATKVLKDGQEVTVDGNTGIIKVIKK